VGRGLPLNILFVVPYAPTRIRIRSRALIRALTANGHRVTVAALWTGSDERRALDDLASEVDAVIAEPMSTQRSLWNCLRALPTRDPLQARFSWNARMSDKLTQAIQAHHYDVVHVEHLRGVAYGLSVLNAGRTGTDSPPPVVWDSVDCISDLFRQAARQSPAASVRWVAAFELPRTERYEGTVASRFPRVLMTSEADRQGLVALAARLSGDRAAAALAERTVVVPNGVELDDFAPTTRDREPSTLVLSGKMSYHANIAAAIGFADDVLPRIRSRRPDTRLVIVGKDPSAAVRALGDRPGVVVTGTVTDMRPYLQTATLAVAPIQYGVGIQNKVLEALACATPVVATSAAVGALGAVAGRDLAVADTPDDMADAVVNLLDLPDARRQMGLAGRRYVEQHHDWRLLAGRLADIYRDARR
jgi:sugar transferase (PEP-CTERM/EpsH1 system associated)